jgi:hypothetical protein
MQASLAGVWGEHGQLVLWTRGTGYSVVGI